MGIGDCGLGVLPADLGIVETAIIVNEWGTYLGEGALERGVEVCVSSWQRVAPNTIPAGAKAGGNYLSSFLIVSEAKERGFAEGIALGTDGLVSEGSGENIFLVRDGDGFVERGTPGLEVAKKEDKLGLRASDTVVIASGVIQPMGIIAGKFQGTIPTNTPSGSRYVTVS